MSVNPYTTPKKRLSSYKKDSPGCTPPAMFPKKVYLIRHGESLGQKANRSRRKSDQSLIDCGLTKTGECQAKLIPEVIGEAEYKKIGLVVTSPLTRALHTSVLAFPHKPIICHYDLREVGSNIPENQPRKMKDVLTNLQIDLRETQIDVDTFRPDQWPRNHDTPPNVVRRDRIRQVFNWLASRPENVVAVVCHYHVIRSALSNPYQISPSDVHAKNAEPILCEIDAEGRLRLMDSKVDDGDGDDDDDDTSLLHC